MSHFSQTSARNADKILNGAHAFLNKFNQNKPEDKKYSFLELIQEYDRSEDSDRKNIAKVLWMAGTPSVVTNSPYPAGMSDTVLEHRANELNYLNNMNICLKDVMVADLGNQETNAILASKIADTLIILDQLSISSQKREKLFDGFRDSFISIDDQDKNLFKLFESGIRQYNEFTLVQTLSKFSIDTEISEPGDDDGESKSLNI